MVTVTDGDGNQHQEERFHNEEISHQEEREKEVPHMHTFTINISYTNGTMRVSTGGETFSHGFSVSLNYGDGHGHYRLPRTQRDLNYTTERWSRSGGEIGLSAAFERTATIDRILSNNRANGWEHGRDEWLQECRAYRADLDVKYRVEAEKVGFCFLFVSLAPCGVHAYLEVVRECISRRIHARTHPALPSLLRTVSSSSLPRSGSRSTTSRRSRTTPAFAT
jgi:hypothetical protein